MANTLAYYDTATITAVKSFIVQVAIGKYLNLLSQGVIYDTKSFIALSKGANVIKLFLSVIYRFLCKARVLFSLGWKSLPMTNAQAYNENP